jgi:hypothetical protein
MHTTATVRWDNVWNTTRRITELQIQEPMQQVSCITVSIIRSSLPQQLFDVHHVVCRSIIHSLFFVLGTEDSDDSDIDATMEWRFVFVG